MDKSFFWGDLLLLQVAEKRDSLWGIDSLFKSNENIRFLSLISKNRYSFSSDKWAPQIIAEIQSKFKIIKLCILIYVCWCMEILSSEKLINDLVHVETIHR